MFLPSNREAPLSNFFQVSWNFSWYSPGLPGKFHVVPNIVPRKFLIHHFQFSIYYHKYFADYKASITSRVSIQNTDMKLKYFVSIFCLDGWGRISLRNVDNYVAQHTTSCARTTVMTFRSCKPQISYSDLRGYAYIVTKRSVPIVG